MAKLNFTQKQIDELKVMQYTAFVNESRLILTLEFKKKFMQEIQEKGATSLKIFQNAGYYPKYLTKQQVYNKAKRIKIEAASEQGLRESPSERHVKNSLIKFQEAEMDNKQTRIALRELQNRMVYLEQQIEFLKKVRLLDLKNEQED